MSETGSPTDHAATDTSTPANDAPASAPPPDTGDTGGTDAKSPDASSAPEGATKADAPKPTLLEVLKAAAEKPDTEGSSPAPAKTETQADAASDKPDAKERPDDDSDLPFHKHERFQEMKAQNRELKAHLRELEPEADQFRKINSFMSENQLTPDEVGEGFIIMAMAKNGDPRVLQKLDEFRERVALQMGEALPPDIQTKVDEGEISESAAKELAKARATATTLERKTAQHDADAVNAQRARDTETIRAAQETAVWEWETQMRKRDPDFASKENAIARYAKALIQEHGPPPTAADAVKLVEAAHAQVSKDFKAALPKKSAVQRPPVASSATGAKPQPKTFREVCEQAAVI